MRRREMPHPELPISAATRTAVKSAARPSRRTFTTAAVAKPTASSTPTPQNASTGNAASRAADIGSYPDRCEIGCTTFAADVHNCGGCEANCELNADSAECVDGKCRIQSCRYRQLPGPL